MTVQAQGTQLGERNDAMLTRGKRGDLWYRPQPGAVSCSMRDQLHPPEHGRAERDASVRGSSKNPRASDT
jgi:hypothetical protein